MNEALHWAFPIAMLLYIGHAGVKGLREMGTPGLSLGQRKVIGTRMLIRIALMGAIALSVFIVTR